ncbi:isochorismate synthase [Knoellia subterranea]|uniref:isochorismate synthase n=1 Tax=Knoellia subterranea KCTC 19937 TaxID=1385521 RepID=A0A0A0JRJ4_9MICO|nr:isochorismate synthase [Knoellia subterranea]KGN38221.1 isochorismate synthase [Knoellia subterranea KCTC 19937]
MTSLPTSDQDSAPLAPLVTRTVSLSPEDGAALLALLPATSPRDTTSWVRRGEGLVGWGRAASVTAHGADRFAALEAWWRSVSSSAVVRDEVDLPGTGPVAFGSISYAAESPVGATLVVPSVVIGRRGDQWWVTTTSTDALPPSVLPAAVDDVTAPGEVAFADGSLSPTEWAGAVAEAVTRIQNDELDKVVLARDLDVRTSEPIDVRWLLSRLAENYESTWVFAVDGLVGATPEMLVRREKGLVTSRVLAGTIRRTGDDEHDLALAASLARSSKDLEEHEYAVRSVADALAPHCSSMNVPESPFVLHLSNVMHLATDVAGVLTDDTTSLALAASLHPSAAVCGTPTPVANELISELEHMDRGRYAGPVGWMDARGDGEWGIALRCGAVHHDDDHRMSLYAGCGIVAGSEPESEVAESDAKLIPMRDALTSPRP